MEELGVVGTGDGVGLEGSIGVTNVTACTLAESPSDPLHRKLRQLRCLRCRFDCYRVERTSSRAGVSPAEVQRLSRRTVTPTDSPPAGIYSGVDWRLR